MVSRLKATEIIIILAQGNNEIKETKLSPDRSTHVCTNNPRQKHNSNSV